MASQPYYFDAEKGIGLCGDWCASFGVGYAWASGNALAKKDRRGCRYFLSGIFLTRLRSSGFISTIRTNSFVPKLK
jgi:hypothetical protein